MFESFVVNAKYIFIFLLTIFQLPDGTGKEPKFVIWGHPGNDVTGMFARCQKVVEPCEEVIAMIIKILLVT